MWVDNSVEENREELGVSEHTGFPNAGTDSSLTSLDVAKLLIQNPSSTFFMRVHGNNWEHQGVFDGDVAVIDRVLGPRSTDLVIWWQGESFAIGKPTKVPKDTNVWGVVTTIIHRFRS
jgi:SOS-response transcriptional repressor LexA